MRTLGWLAAILLALAILMVAATQPAGAAVRRCAKPILGEMKTAPTRTAAHRAAITSWRLKAAHHGRAYTSWRLAMNKRFGCVRVKSGAKTGEFMCVAFARPCRILQRPPFGRRTPSPRPLPPSPAPRIKPKPPQETPRAI